jgi:hypothetical protein
MLDNAELAEEYYYQSLSLCVIDAVFRWFTFSC